MVDLPPLAGRGGGAPPVLTRGAPAMANKVIDLLGTGGRNTGGGDQAPPSPRTPPHSREAEQAVLGSLFLDPQVLVDVAERVRESDFYLQGHQVIFDAVGKLDDEGKPFDLVMVGDWLESHQQLDDAGGLAYLNQLAENTPSAGNAVYYADIVRRLSVLRQLIHATTEIVEVIFNTETRNSDQVLDFAEQKVFEIAEQEMRGKRSYEAIQTLMTSAMERVDELFRNKSHITGIATGFADLDERTAGLQRSDLIVVAGRPSMGKTAFALNMAEYAAIKEKLAVAVFSMEMSGQQLALRMLASLSRIDQQKVRTGRLEASHFDSLTATVGQMQGAKLVIDETPALTPAELRARCRRLKSRSEGLDLVIVDFLQLMQIPGTKEKDGRVSEVSEISRSLKAMAKELGVPVIALSQLNRSLESRPNKRPVMSDLRESGAIEQDADVILFIYRDEVYNDESEDAGMAEIIIGKQRNGPIGTVKLAFLKEITRFEDYVEQDSYPYVPGQDE